MIPIYDIRGAALTVRVAVRLGDADVAKEKVPSSCAAIEHGTLASYRSAAHPSR